MAVMLIESTDPSLSFHLKKNPNTGLTIKKMRSGILTGWFPVPRRAHNYALYFRESGADNSFSNDDSRNHMDLTQYASTYFVFNSISTLFNNTLKLDDTQSSYDHTIHIPIVQLRTKRTIEHLNAFIGLNLEITNKLDESLDRMSVYDIKITYTGTFNEFMMKVYVLFYLLHGDLYQSDIVWMEAMITKVVGVMKELRSEYFLWYWFKKNILVKPTFYAKLQDELGKNSVDGPMTIQYGDTQTQRKNFVMNHMAGFDRPILDVGCGGGDYLLPYAKKLAATGNHRIVGVDIDADIVSKLQYKLEDRKHNNASVYTSLDEVQLDEEHDIICIEVIEHMPLEDARALVANLLKRNFRKLIISTPNRDFNKYYRTMVGFRHDDHHFEFSREEFKEFMNELAPANDIYDGKILPVGDKVGDIPMAWAAVIKKV